MKTFGDLKLGDTVYVIYPKYNKKGSWRYQIGDFKIKELYEWIPYSDGNAQLTITLDNGFHFNPISNQTFHYGIDKEEGGGIIGGMSVEYFTDINNIKLINDYEYVIKDIEKTLRKKYKL